MTGMYSLVEFVSTGDLGVVPSKWIQKADGKCTCYWPPRSVINAVRSCKDYNPSTWTEHDIKVLDSFMTYKEAQKGEQRHLDDLDSNTESDENLGRGKRKKIPKYLLDSFGDSLLAEQNKILRQSPAHSIVSQEDAIERISGDEADISLLESSYSNGSCNQNEKEVRETGKSISEDVMSVSVAASKLSAIVEAKQEEEEETGLGYREIFNKLSKRRNEGSTVGSGANPSFYGRLRSESGPAGFRVRRETADVMVKEEPIGMAQGDAAQPESMLVGKKSCYSSILQQLIDEVASLRREIRIQRSEVFNPRSKPVQSPRWRLQQGLPVVLPFQSVVEVEQFEEKLLLEQKMRKQLVANIAGVGGISLGNAIKRILQGLFTDEAASHYSWEGRKGKRELKGMMLMSLIVAALQTGYVLECADMSLATIKRHISQWFQSAGKMQMRKWREENRGPETDFAAVEEPKKMDIPEVKTEDYGIHVDSVETSVKIEVDYLDY